MIWGQDDMWPLLAGAFALQVCDGCRLVPSEYIGLVNNEYTRPRQLFSIFHTIGRICTAGLYSLKS
jgi:hypothetical protein